MAHSSCPARSASVGTARTSVPVASGRQGSAEAVGAEDDPRPVVVEAGRCGAVKQRRAEGVQGAVADVELLSGVEQVHAVEGERPLGRHDAGAEKRGDHSGFRCGIEQVEQPAGVVAVGVGEPDPAHVGGVHHRSEILHEVAVGQREPGVDDDRLARVQDEGVDREIAETVSPSGRSGR